MLPLTSDRERVTVGGRLHLTYPAPAFGSVLNPQHLLAGKGIDQVEGRTIKVWSLWSLPISAPLIDPVLDNKLRGWLQDDQYLTLC